eukprot:2018738-Prymnesium_polylepis.1
MGVVGYALTSSRKGARTSPPMLRIARRGVRATGTGCLVESMGEGTGGGTGVFFQVIIHSFADFTCMNGSFKMHAHSAQSSHRVCGGSTRRRVPHDAHR